MKISERCKRMRFMIRTFPKSPVEGYQWMHGVTDPIHVDSPSCEDAAHRILTFLNQTTGLNAPDLPKSIVSLIERAFRESVQVIIMDTHLKQAFVVTPVVEEDVLTDSSARNWPV